VKRLIVNADDFGLTSGVNRAIREAHQRGIVTSTTLMAKGAAFDDALQAAAAVPGLGIGCHVDLVQLSPVSPRQEVASLAAGDQFRPGVARLAAAAWSGKIKSEEIVLEATAQMRKLQSAGVTLTHFDTHKHTHVFPPVLRALLQAARDCGVRAVRNPFEPESTVGFRHVFARMGLLSRWAAVQSLRAFAPDFRREVQRAGLMTTDGTVGVALTGHMNQRMLCDMLQRIPHGTWELVTHPGYSDAQLAPLTKLTASREVELDWLTSKETREMVDRAGIELVSFKDLNR
jgi:hopanoid biosynthesis associated protein HpnK